MTYEGAGVTVVSWKLEQSAAREVASGFFPIRVPVTALAQLSASQLSLSGVRVKTLWAMAKARMKDKSLIIAISERVCVWMNLRRVSHL
jgi:hypothetical protein